ncbi:hypothetical protein J422_02869 [Methanocaldococcus villosus KIN24-T80]|uniref:Uncharacterized protein n=1 Tax=Methanocaldococcus villosus KIN24-T80 TaxID=1069083 RepID=N6VZ26_9EURY|nr:hypothetical protein [Methanocaldococcus villosus]ENN96382.1 hypothetical protein J422_02869 [Methanocaldococcus villosus KIN24-T80]
MKCPYCGGDCIDKDMVNLYLKSVEMFFKFQSDNELVKKYPPAGEIGECKKTFNRIYLCPYCKEPFKAYYNNGKAKIVCPNCKKTLLLPITNRSVC